MTHVDNEILWLLGAFAGLYIALLTGEILMWLMTGGQHRISVKNALKYGRGEGGFHGTGTILDLLFLFLQPPFLLGTAFWGLLLYAWFQVF